MAQDRQILGVSPAIDEIREKLPLVAACDATVLISGETGTGKEVLARTIHRLSPRATQAFVAVNCGGMPRDLVENELFGHKRGAYSGAVEDRKGLVEMAQHGTLFLDEIDSLPLDIQPKLLRLLQEKEYRAVGDGQTRKVKVRFIAATATDLAKRMRENSFRTDLFYRLSVFHLHLPPLRDRKEDIPLFARVFVDLYAGTYGKGRITLSDRARDHLMRYNWPGNVRELEHAIHRAVVWCQESQLQPEHFDLPFGESMPDIKDWDQPYHVLRQQVIDRFECEYVRQILKAHRANVSSAARAAGLDRRTFQRLMSRHDMTRESIISQ